MLAWLWRRVLDGALISLRQPRDFTLQKRWSPLSAVICPRDTLTLLQLHSVLLQGNSRIGSTGKLILGGTTVSTTSSSSQLCGLASRLVEQQTAPPGTLDGLRRTQGLTTHPIHAASTCSSSKQRSIANVSASSPAVVVFLASAKRPRLPLELRQPPALSKWVHERVNIHKISTISTTAVSSGHLQFTHTSTPPYTSHLVRVVAY